MFVCAADASVSFCASLCATVYMQVCVRVCAFKCVCVCVCVCVSHRAGKTTLISILTGMESATSGSATVNGMNVTTDIDSIRQDLGE